MNALNMAIVGKTQTAALMAMNDQELIGVLKTSLYPGAADESIKLVIGYCKAAGLDPMQKPVHIVPMDVKNKDGKYEKRDVIMPGIGLYRIQAARTNLYAGVTEPEFGDVKKMAVKRKQYNNAFKDDKSFAMVDDGETVDFPEWCRVTVKRLVGNVVVDFTSKEFWLENYATAGKDSTSPNAMWKKRPYAQLAKCAEAQALRKAFPELGAAPTADEMEGKTFEDNGNVIDGSTGEIVTKREAKPEPLPQDVFDAQSEGWKKAIVSGKKTADALVSWINAKGALLTDSQKQVINSWVPAKAEKDPFVADMEKVEGEFA
ncbi:bet_lambda, phage recombination protein Bet [uncultured Caudovirales phage]|uniref:Bet_lambda, phage recombination protein Bet n=1 Tax=uncultured Caudovirales phage TaxID=2100421 RepID=A0A6J5R4L2_9CAUD|nr:bet_lambda, phage recombination protein Bet [uncultured Caudovirales phage]